MSPEAGLALDPVSGARDAGEQLANRLPPLMVEADRVAATVAQGVHGRRRTGIGETFWQFRAYQPGDDAAEIDWRQSARSRHLFVREQEWEAAASVWLWCDLSPSMGFRSARTIPSKRERALVLTLGLASLLVRGGERVALLGSGERPRSGRAALNHLTRLLAHADQLGETQIPSTHLPRHARLVLVSDFLQPLPGLEPRLAAHVASGARGCLLQVCDPAEELLPYSGRVLFEGMEQDGRQLIGNVEVVRARYRAAYRAHRETLGQLCSRQGWRFTVHRTDGSAESGLLALYHMLAPKLGF
jgi:uncharacterized protein (DUF58 family)